MPARHRLATPRGQYQVGGHPEQQAPECRADTEQGQPGCGDQEGDCGGSAILLEPPRSTHLRFSFSYATPERIEEGIRRLALVIRSMHAGGRQRHSMPLI